MIYKNILTHCTCSYEIAFIYGMRSFWQFYSRCYISLAVNGMEGTCFSNEQDGYICQFWIWVNLNVLFETYLKYKIKYGMKYYMWACIFKLCHFYIFLKLLSLPKVIDLIKTFQTVYSLQ